MRVSTQSEPVLRILGGLPLPRRRLLGGTFPSPARMLVSFRPFESAEKALNENMGVLESLSDCDPAQVQMLQRQVGMLPERPIRSYGTPKNDAGFGHGRNDDLRVAAFFRDTLMEEVAVRAPSFQGRLHRGRRYRQIIEAKRR